MNSLEFINRQIGNINEIIEQNKIKIEENVLFESLKEHYQSYNKELEQLKLTLQQIKAELEAWEVVKEDIDYQEIEYCSERAEYTYEYKKWSFQLTEDYPNFEEKSEKLKKALEVEDE